MTTTRQRTNADTLNRTLFIADNLPVLQGIDSNSVSLIATDPPFNKGVKAFEGIVTAGVDAAGKKVSYKDVWTWGDVQEGWVKEIREDHPNLHAVIQAANAAAGEDMGAFLCWLGVRLLEMHRILRPDGSLYLHIDHTAHAYTKMMMDAIFGRGNFRNEIVWYYNKWTNTAAHFQQNHDTLLWYSKTPEYVFHKQFDEPTKRQLELRKAGYNRGSQGGRQILRVYDKEKAAKQIALAEAEGRAVYYVNEPLRGAPVPDVWDISALNGQAKERTGYPTQKPLALYERIIKASSNPGDVVLDPFAGCATTAVAAERLGRGWIAIDINAAAQDVVLTRLQKEAQLPTTAQSWDRAVQVLTDPPARTDDGQAAAPELINIRLSEALTLTDNLSVRGGRIRRRDSRLPTRQIREMLIQTDGCICQGCGWEPPLGEYLEVDHRVPKSAGGDRNERNLILLCSPCNGVKSNKLTLAELRRRRLDADRMLNPRWDEAWYQREGRFG